MIQVTLKDEDYQTVSVSFGAIEYSITLYKFRSLVYFNVRRGREYVLAGKRCMTNQWMLPLYLTSGEGNLRFETYAADRESYVWPDGFNTKFRLMAYSRTDLPDNYWSA